MKGRERLREKTNRPVPGCLVGNEGMRAQNIPFKGLCRV